jgi:anti-sigma factor RsiW
MKLDSPNPSPRDDAAEKGLSLEQFDLLSAYLDGEVTPSERQKVRYWLENDPKFQKNHQKLLHLQRGLTHLSPPSVSSIPSDLPEHLFRKIDRQRHHRNWSIAGGVTLVVLLTTAFSQINFSENAWTAKLAKHFSAPGQINAQPLKLALNRPLVEIPTE